MLNEYGHKEHIPSEDYIFHVTKLFDKSIEKVKENGMIPYKYKHMGLSPRILPQNYGMGFNSVKKEVRNLLLSQLSDLIKPDSVIIDVDLKSCYTTILLVSIPKEQVLQRQ
jgi:hypothetical protein